MMIAGHSDLQYHGCRRDDAVKSEMIRDAIVKSAITMSVISACHRAKNATQ